MTLPLFEETTMNERKEYEGKYIKLFFTSENFNVGIFEFMKAESDPDSAKNYFTSVAHFPVDCDVPLIITGHWETNRKYDQRQFIIESAAKSNKLDRDGLIDFLQNHPDIVGIGKVKATRIADYCGDNFEDVLYNDENGLIRETRISKDVITNLKTVWDNAKLYNKVIIHLSEMGFTFNQCVKIFKEFGDKSVIEVEKNPYILIEKIERMGFLTVDAIAQKLSGFTLDSLKRIKAGVEYVLNIDVQQGHCWSSIDDVAHNSYALLGINKTIIIDFLKTPKNGFVVNYGRVSLNYTNHHEKFVADFILSKGTKKMKYSKAMKPEKYGEFLNDDQLATVKKVLENQFSIITGKAGTGKTYVIKTLYRIFTSIGLNVELASPTGRAAKRIKEVVGEDAFTIHRLLGSNSITFLYNKDERLDVDVVIIDEFSMVDINLAYHLMSAMGDKAVLICVGDHNQLPPVGPGNVLRDIINMNKDPQFKLDNVSELTQIVRQAGELKKNSVSILDGQLLPTTTEVDKFGRKEWYSIPFEDGVRAYDLQQYILNIIREIRRISFDPLNDVQIITPMKNGETGVRELNLVVQECVQKMLFDVDTERPKTDKGRPNFYKHDRVIQMVNDYELSIMNGEIGRVTTSNKNGVEIQFEDELIFFKRSDAKLLNVELAYVLTIHKTQGSEYPCVIIVMHSQNWRMLHRNLIYTAVTRAKKTAFVIGEYKALNKAIMTVEVDDRRTSILQIIKEKK